MMFLVFLILIRTINADGLYSNASACLFNTIETYSTSSIIECAIKCDSVNCKAVHFVENNAMCNLYAFHEICQSHTKCEMKPVFINDRYNDKVSLCEL